MCKEKKNSHTTKLHNIKNINKLIQLNNCSALLLSHFQLKPDDVRKFSFKKKKSYIRSCLFFSIMLLPLNFHWANVSIIHCIYCAHIFVLFLFFSKMLYTLLVERHLKWKRESAWVRVKTRTHIVHTYKICDALQLLSEGKKQNQTYSNLKVHKHFNILSTAKWLFNAFHSKCIDANKSNWLQLNALHCK